MTERKARVLIVDDHAVNRYHLQMILEGSGFDIRETEEGAEVFATCLDFQPDLVILDLHMPQMDGFAVLREMEELPERDYLPVIMITADDRTEVRQQALSLGVKDFLTKPFDSIEVVLRVRNLLETRRLHQELARRNQRLEEKVAQRTSELSSTVALLRVSEAELRLSREETIERLAMAAEFRDLETARHINRMSRYCGLLADWAGMGEARSDLISVASALHDVGKIGIPDSILRKPGPLSPAEIERMRTHTEIGHRMLAGSQSEVIQLAAVIALTHHERLNGTGYPNGLKGEEIPVEGRITAIGDVFDALTTDRVYRPAYEVEDAVTIMKEGHGTQFDGDLLEIFLDNLPAVLEIRATYDAATA